MDITFELGTVNDIDELEQLYNDLNDHLEQGIKAQIKSIRLDVYESKLPAIKFYEKCGFKYIDTVDLCLGNYGLDWFRLYEKLLNYELHVHNS